MDTKRLQDAIARLQKKYSGTFSLHMQCLEREGEFGIRADEVRPTASACKLFVLCELFRQAEAGEIDLNAPVTWRPEQHMGGAGVLRAMVPGQTLSIHNMAILMMMVSDNIATQVLVERVGSAPINRTLRAWGLEQSDMREGFSPQEKLEGGREAVSTARDLCRLLRLIYRQDVLTPSSCDEIIRILRAQRCNDMLPRYLPVGQDWGQADTWIANKTGYGSCIVEAGIVKDSNAVFALGASFRPDQYVSSPFKSVSDQPSILAVAALCKAAYDAVAASGKPSTSG